MTRNNKHKPHRQSKHSSRDDREPSVSDEGGKVREKSKKDEMSVKTSRDSSSCDKRKHDSKGKEDRELPVHANGGTTDLHNSKRRRERAEASGSDRWNGGGSERADGRGADKQTRAGNSRQTGLLEANGKSGRRKDAGDDTDETMVEKDKCKASKAETKHRTERSSTGKDEHCKDSKERDNVAGSDKKTYDGKRGLDEVKKVVSSIDDQPTKYTGNTESTLPKDLRNLELEKELEKRIRRRSGGSGERDKMQDDIKDLSERRLSSKGDHFKDGRYKDEVSKDGAEKNKIREEPDKNSRHHDEKHKRHVGKEKRHIDGKYRDEAVWNDRYGDNYSTKNSKTEIDVGESHCKNSRKQSRRDASPIYEGKRPRHKDDREKKRSDDRDDQSEARSRGINDHRHDSENRSNTDKFDRDSDRGRSRPHHGDMDFTSAHSRQKSSPTPSSNIVKDPPRTSNRSETGHKDGGSEERNWGNSGEASIISAVMENAPTSQAKGSSANKESPSFHGNRTGAFGAEETGGDFGRTHPSGSSRFLHPPPPLPSRVAGADSSSSETNRDSKRYGDSGAGRCQGNAWRGGVPNWPNTFFPFQNGMPSVGFPPSISPFSPSIFGVRPSMELNHNRVPYHMADPDRFPSHARHFGWLNRVDWETKAGSGGDESSRYGRVEWDPNRNTVAGRGIVRNDSEGKGDWPRHLPQAEENWTLKSADQIPEFENENKKPVEPEKNESNFTEKTDKTDKTDTVLKKGGGRDDFSYFYFSKLEISPSLTEKDLYDRCSVLSKKEEMVKEKDERVKVKGHAKTSTLADVNDTVFKRAMSLYKKQVEERKAAVVVYTMKKTHSDEVGRDDVTPASTSEPGIDPGLRFSARDGATAAVSDVGCDVTVKMNPGDPVSTTEALGGSNDSDLLTLCRIPQSQYTH